MKKNSQSSHTEPDETNKLETALDKRLGRRTFLKGALATAPLLIGAPTLLLPRKSAAAANIGPSTTTEPYLIPSVPGVKFVSILTVGDDIGGYRMVGIPDGLGAFQSDRGQFTLLMNHEINPTATPPNPGIVRKHGSNGAFVSRWIIDQQTLKVLKGEDLTPSSDKVHLWDPSISDYEPTGRTTQWRRLCSADLPRKSALFDSVSGLGIHDRIFFDGEEVSEADSARAWARRITGPHAGEAWQLPRLGRMSYENVVACPHSMEKTVVLLTDDGDLSTAPSATGFPSELYVYIGEKAKAGHPIEQAGFTGGSLYGLQVILNGSAVTEESDLFGLGTVATGFIGKASIKLVILAMSPTLRRETSKMCRLPPASHAFAGQKTAPGT